MKFLGLLLIGVFLSGVPGSDISVSAAEDGMKMKKTMAKDAAGFGIRDRSPYSPRNSHRIRRIRAKSNTEYSTGIDQPWPKSVPRE